MIWETYIKEFETYLKLERSLSDNSILAYLADIKRLGQFIEQAYPGTGPNDINVKILREFLDWANELGIQPRTQARLVSGIKTFFRFLLIEEFIETNPANLVDIPRTERKLPTVLTTGEVDSIISAIDLSKPEGQRNKAMIETLYSCGLRVSELIGLKLSNLFFDQGFIRVIGKGDKDRLVPIGQQAMKEIKLYLDHYRSHLPVKKEAENIVFLNRRGNKLTRVMVYTIVKELSVKAGIKKNISPHTFRHSFASHLVEGGADLRAVQEMLGHESILTTEIYTHLDKTYLREAILQFHPRS